jgi:sodium transport system ATP-binding protein
VIDVQDVHKRFERGHGSSKQMVYAVQGVSFQAADGAITGLLGPNGAGKTTCLRMVTGLMTPDRGTAVVDGADVRVHARLALSRLGVLSDARGLYTRLSARENIRYYAQLQGVPRALCDERLDRLATTLEMRELLDRRTEGFSQGERMKTALARALIHDPPNVVLDEPTNGLDVLATRALRGVLRRLRDEQGKCVVLATHIMQEVERLCDHVVVVAHGRTVAQGGVAELKERAGQSDFEEAFVSLAFAPQQERS